tara:strand:- start:290 stop:505 length:216 start_codon:yes stop_codon:yes gene_type:complete
MGSDDQGTKKPSFFTKTQIENDVVRTLSLSLSLESEVTPSPSNNNNKKNNRKLTFCLLKRFFSLPHVRDVM